MEQLKVSGIKLDRSQSKISICHVPDRPGIAARIFRTIAEADIIVDIIVQNLSRDGYSDISFTVPRSEVERAVAELQTVKQDIGAEDVVSDARMATVSVMGVGMRSHPDVATRIFRVLAAEAINIEMISTSEMVIACVIDDAHAERAERALNGEFRVGDETAAR